MSSKQQSILLGGIVTGLLSTSYLGMINVLCCAGVIMGSMVAVWHYTTNNELTIPTGQGATLGLLAALVGFLISFVLNYVLIQAGVRSDLVVQEFILDRFGDSMPPEQVDAMIEQMEAELTFTKYLLSSLGNGVIVLIFGAIGGAIGAAVFKNGPDE